MAEKPKAEDEAPPVVGDHPFEPRGKWWSLCKHCGLARAAHSSSTIDVQKAMFEEQMARYGEVRRARPEVPKHSYVSDDSRPGDRHRAGVRYVGDDEDE